MLRSHEGQWELHSTKSFRTQAIPWDPWSPLLNPLYLASSWGKRGCIRDCVGESFRSPFWKHISLHPSLGQDQSQNPTSGSQGMEDMVREKKEIGFGGHRLNISATSLHRLQAKIPSHINGYNYTYFIELWGLKKMFVERKVNGWHTVGAENILLIIMAVFQESDSIADWNFLWG